MFKRKSISIFVAGLLIASFIFLSLPEKSYSGMAMVISGCCQVGPECSIYDGPSELDGCLEAQGIAFPGEVCNEETGMCTGMSPARDVPTLSEWGLIVMAGILGFVGFMFIRRSRVPV